MSLRDAIKKVQPETSPATPVQEGRALTSQTDDAADFGPAMSACKPKERAFVLAVMAGENFANAARLAGYATPESSPATLASIGNRIKGYPRVAAALVEEAKNSLRSLAPRAVSTVREVLETFDPKARLKAADMILSRTDPPVSRVEGKIEHEIVDRTQQSLDYLAHLIAKGASEQFLLAEFGPGGLERYRKLLEARERAKEVVDAEFTVIEEKSDE